MLMPPMSSPGVGLVAAAHQHGAVHGMRAQELLGFHREEIAIEHRARLQIRFGHRLRRQLHREAARLPHAALHFLHALLEMRVARIQVTPRRENRNDRLAAEILARVAHLQRARAMTERAQVLRAEPAMAAQIFRALSLRHAWSLLGKVGVRGACRAAFSFILAPRRKTR
jgi:hypothetical protein